MELPAEPLARADAASYLLEDGDWEYEKAERVWDAGAVGTITMAGRKPLRFEAAVRGTKVYTVTLTYKEAFWTGQCTCPIAIDCKHCRATVIELLALWDDLEKETLSAPAPAAKAGKGAKKASPPEKSALVQEAESRLGRAPKAAEARVLGLIDEAFSRHAQTEGVPESAIAEIYGPPKPWSWQRYKLWPAPPNSAWETWLYVLHFIREQNQKAPEFLASVTSEAELQALIGPWQWRLEVHRWREQLARAAPVAGVTDAGTVELRVVYQPEQALLQMRRAGGEWLPVRRGQYDKWDRSYARITEFGPAAASLWACIAQERPGAPEFSYQAPEGIAAAAAVLRNPLFAEAAVTAGGEPFRREPGALRWVVQPPPDEAGHYGFRLEQESGAPLPAAILYVGGRPSLYVTADTIFKVRPLGGLGLGEALQAKIPAPALEDANGVALLESAEVPLPERIARRVLRHEPKLIIKASLEKDQYRLDETLKLRVLAEWPESGRREKFTGYGWSVNKAGNAGNSEQIVAHARTGLGCVADLLGDLKLAGSEGGDWTRRITKKFPEEFGEWLKALPPHVELRLDPLLASLRDEPLKARVQLDAEPVGVDWFDLTVALEFEDLELTPEELQSLLKAKGGWVRLGEKGWRRLSVQLSGEEDIALADLGLSPRDLASGEKQRLHALQLSAAGADRLLPQRTVEDLRARARDLKASVSPSVPAAITAELRPYQIEGFHFLAYLSTNRFGGLLADDMGLGKTVQTLAWLTWLREQPAEARGPSLVVCPKSVMDNWEAEARRFAPHLRVMRWVTRSGATIAEAVKEHDLLVLNYTQLRLLEDELGKVEWLAAILDEAQAIKNPDSQTTQAARTLRAAHRLALTGTPIENRLLDLWSIMSFTMPGVLGIRANFARTYDQKDDPLARRRLAARTRPFVIRRTKEQVARDLPPRVEEELVCEMEGRQATLYRAELKRARQQLLKIKTAKELDGARFNILTSLLRLRQICCHPGLVEEESMEKPSAKLEALLELLEPLIEEGRKVLVFSQFVGVLEIIQRAIEAKSWRYFMLTGQTENRGDLIAEFQRTEGAAVFLLSLKASGFGLNLTAASDVVLYDPWWNPAVENQAIDRTHRIGQKSTVFAYRLLIKDSIEEKIRTLQKQKRALAQDILGEESFARALTLDDLRTLLAE